MAQSPTVLHKKQQQLSSLLPRRSNETSSPISYEQSDARNNISSAPQLQQRKIFGFQLYIDNDILNVFGPSEVWFENLSKQHGIQHIGFNDDLTIPDLNGKNIQIYDIDMQKKYQCAKEMLLSVGNIFKQIKKQSFAVIIFVPEGMVSLLIGAKGHQINKIMKQSHTTIVVNQPINRMTYRTAKIQGAPIDVAKACRIIYQMLEEKSSIAYSIQKQPSQLDYTKSKIKSKFIFPDSLVSYLERKKKRPLAKAEDTLKCSLKFQSQKQNRSLKKDQWVCIMRGRLEDVQAMVVMLVNLSHQFLSQQKRNLDYTLKMLIPANYVTKLIGQKGYMIRDIIQRSGGANIKILSDKAEKDRECIISINGTKQNKIDAACFIMQQIQCFKNGGPILQSGKSINENLAQQFKNSIPLRDEEYQNKNTSNTVMQVPPAVQFGKKQNQSDSQQEGLIQAEDDPQQKQKKQRQEKQRLQKQKRMAIQKDLARINPIKKSKSKSKSRSRSDSKSRSRDRERKKSKKMEFSRKIRSESESAQYKHDRDSVQVKLVIPKKLGQDQKQLKYIESLCKSTLTLLEQRLETGEMILSIRGSLKDNSRCIQLLQKRLARYKTSNSSSAR